ncbi:MAG: type transport system permease protein [Streptosporangiaceae bacterium]|nr:type transport system permease protein [Streptosporangiaceae bacterium]
MSSATTAAAPLTVPGATRWRLTPRSGIAVVSAEVRKGLTRQLANPVAHLVTLAFAATMYLGMQYVIGEGALERDLLPRTLVGISSYWFLHFACIVMVSDLVEEMRGGTFAQALLTPSPLWLVMLGRLLTASVFGLVVSVTGTLVPMLVTGTTIPLEWAALVPYALVVVNALAFTFVMAALALNSPMVAVLEALLTSLVLLLNGAFMPLSLYPDWMAVLARLLPTTLGVEATAKTLFEGRSLGDIWNDGTLPWLLVYTAALVLAGWALFVRNHRKALRDGRLGQY